jgi:hypothetical protein
MGRTLLLISKTVTTYPYLLCIFVERFVPNEATEGLYREITMTFPGGSLTAKRDVLESLFNVDLLPDQCAPAERVVTRKEYTRTKFVGATPSAIIRTEPYVLRTYGSGDSSNAAGGEPIRFLINNSWWTARLNGTHQDFNNYLCVNRASFKYNAIYWVSSGGRKTFLTSTRNTEA